MLKKALLATPLLFTVSTFAATETRNLTPVVKGHFPLAISESQAAGYDKYNYDIGYLASFAQAYVDISKYFTRIDSVCFEVDTSYSGQGMTPGRAGVALYSYYVRSATSRRNNYRGGSSTSLANPTYSQCFNENEGYAKSFIREGKIAFTPYTTDPSVKISDVRVSVTGESKVRGELLTLNTKTHVLGTQVGEPLKHTINANMTYVLEVFENKAKHNAAGNTYRSVGVSYINRQNEAVITAIAPDAPTFVTTQGELSLFVVGDDTTSEGDIVISVKQVNID